MGLAFESTRSTSPPNHAEAIVKTLQELQKLHVSEQNAQRANLFHKLVTELRGLSSEAVTSLLPKLLGALLQARLCLGGGVKRYKTKCISVLLSQANRPFGRKDLGMRNNSKPTKDI